MGSDFGDEDKGVESDFGDEDKGAGSDFGVEDKGAEWCGGGGFGGGLSGGVEKYFLLY